MKWPNPVKDGGERAVPASAAYVRFEEEEGKACSIVTVIHIP